MSNWRVAKSLLELRSQVDAAHPDRHKENDGTIGDESHSSRSSDHNPDANGVVCAEDITNDPLHGVVSEKLAQSLLDSRDPRIKYVISNRKIAAGYPGPQPWVWRPYHGSNPHDHHCHISVIDQEPIYDNEKPWFTGLTGALPIAPPDPTAPVLHAVLRRGAGGKDVEYLQQLLNVKGAKDNHGNKLDEDGDFATKTFEAVENYQKANHLEVDGKVGIYTWNSLEDK